MTSTPATPETSKSAPSTTRSAPSASAWKDGSPGVSMMFSRWPSPLGVRSAAEIDIERRFSSSSWSETVVPSATDAEAVDRARLEQQRLDERRLARPAMAENGDVADLPGLLRHERSFRPGVCVARLYRSPGIRRTGGIGARFGDV